MKLHRHLIWLLILAIGYITANAQTFSSSFQLREGPKPLNPTSIDFGPDQKLYLLDVTGDIYIMAVQRVDTGIQILYNVINTDTLTLVRNIPNHNDDGLPHEVVTRQATGIHVVGTPSHPMIYVTSSDYRIKNLGGPQTNLDTNSGIISRISWTGSAWDKVDLVRGLPRSEENHATNGLLLDTIENALYVAQGGNTNAGGPGFLLGSVSEYALSAAILRVDLNALDTLPVLVDSISGQKYIYDIPTVDDPRRANHNGIDDPMTPGYDGVDINDPFGGNDGLNQAKWLADGPVQVYSSGYRNPYDVIQTKLGHLFSWDNGPNSFWGGAPINEGFGTATNEQTGTGGTVYNFDGLHYIDTAGYYAGHPNPIRSNPDSAGLLVGGSFLTQYDAMNTNQSLPYDWPPVDSSLRDPQQGIYLPATQPGDVSLVTVGQSTNGMAEYTATNFDSVMRGDIIAVGFSNTVWRAYVDSTGTGCDSVDALFTGPTNMLDILCQGDDDPFPGTIWIARHISSNTGIVVYEPQDFSGCVGGDFAAIDEDLDGYTNADEIDNGTDPCNAADSPAFDDFDKTFLNGFLVSDLNDPDDDDDGIPDSVDYFVLDPFNGQSTALPVNYPLLNNSPGTGFFGLGFTGLMSNGREDYLNLIKDENNSTTEIIAGGASGVLSFIKVDTGDATGLINTQKNAFQFGFPVDSSAPPILVRVTGIGPVFPDTIQDAQSIGAYVGVGDQDNYIKLAVTSIAETPRLQLVVEEAGVASLVDYPLDGIDTALTVDFFFVINPANGMVFPYYSLDDTIGIPVGSGVQTTGPLFEAIKGESALATGVIATAAGSTSQFEATWDYFVVRYAPELNGIDRSGDWIVENDGSNCMPGTCGTGRHECAFVESGDKFYLLGGREGSSIVEAYDPVSEVWISGSVPPVSPLHHFQGVDYHGMIIVAGALTGGPNFATEELVDSIYVYDPIEDSWHLGPSIPADRIRGAAASSIVGDSLYLIGGNTMGHFDGAVGWADRYDLVTNSWDTLPDAPHSRDHFHSAVLDRKIYAIAGRRTGSDGTYADMEEQVDVFDIESGSWQTLTDTIPTKRAGAGTAVLHNEILVMGGEDGPGIAYQTTEALNVNSETWRTLEPMTSNRHGFQAISNNGNIYVAAGALLQGFVDGFKQERYEPYGPTNPILTPTVQSTLSAPDTVEFPETLMLGSSRQYLEVSNTNGNQAMLIHSLSITDSVFFTVDTVLSFPRFLKPGAVLRIPVSFAPMALETYSDTLVINHTGTNAPTTSIVLTGDGKFNWLGGERIYVDSSATAVPQYGVSWDSAVTSLAMALDAAADFPEIREIWVAKGTYTPGHTRSASFMIADSITILGGFEGVEITAESRNTELNPVILSGDIGVVGDSTDNVIHVVTIPVEVDTAFIDGITVSHGQADGLSPDERYGAGVMNFGNAVLSDVTITRCVASDAGSAVFSSGVNAVLRLAMVSLIDNSDPFLVNKNGSTIRWIGTGILR